MATSGSSIVAGRPYLMPDPSNEAAPTCASVLSPEGNYSVQKIHRAGGAFVHSTH